MLFPPHLPVAPEPPPWTALWSGMFRKESSQRVFGVNDGLVKRRVIQQPKAMAQLVREAPLSGFVLTVLTEHLRVSHL